MQRKQFPVRPAFAITANKSQGQTLDRIGLYLDRSMFTHGQLYVALSRTCSATNIKTLIKNAHLSDNNLQFTDNIVYPEIL